MVFVGIVFIALIILVICVIDDNDDRFNLVYTLVIAGIACVIATYVVKTTAINDAVNLYKQGSLTEEITIKQTTEYGKVKIDTLYNYSRP